MQANYDANSVATRYGDAILETSIAGYGSAGWNGDYSKMPFAANSFITRGSANVDEESAGIFSFSYTAGNAATGNGFRVTLI